MFSLVNIAISTLISVYTATPVSDSIAPSLPPQTPAASVRHMTVTAYSSTPEQTDDSPFITASNTRVRDGVVATNVLPFGTRIRIPEYFGSKEFTVEDRMHRRHANRVDIWFPTTKAALRFGITDTDIEVLSP